jgi:hypothetical protein
MHERLANTEANNLAPLVQPLVTKCNNACVETAH